MKRKAAGLTSLQFYSKLRWLDGRPLLIEPYRCEIFTKAFDTFQADGSPVYNLVLAGRGKKNNKTLDLVLAALYCTVARRRAVQGNDALILASDEDQAADDLGLCRKLVEINPELRSEFEILAKELRLRDGSGSIRILPAKDVSGSHGKQYGLCGFDEIHTTRDWNLLEALQPDPTRPDALMWITSYDTIYSVPGVPLYDLKQKGKAGSDPRMLFSWYSGADCTDPAFAELPPEQRANPSMQSWPEGAKYLAQQKRRLPTHKYRRLHLNLPGAPTGAFLDQGKVLDAIVTGRRVLLYNPAYKYWAFVDMSGGSKDDAVLCIGHLEDGTIVIDLIEKQAGKPPFNPRNAVRKFIGILPDYHIKSLWGDNYAAETFKSDWREAGLRYTVCPRATELYEAFEPVLNAGEVELPDIPILQEQALCLVMKGGGKIEAEKNGHDDWINAVAGLVWLLRSQKAPMRVTWDQVREVQTVGALRRAGVGGLPFTPLFPPRPFGQ